MKYVLSDDDIALDEAASRLVEALIETIEHEYNSEVEPFEQYSKRIRLHLFQEIHNYSDRIVQGHEALLQELSKMKEK
ncbi:MAG: hypothetical protein VX777_05920 [Chlamydiota bacterium]|nr:hypothetical protein [Chlamydiota bacterium]